MAGKRIKGITIEIDGNVTKLDKALASVDSHLGETQKNLKDVNRLLKMDPGNTVLLAQKQRLLSDAVSDTRERLDTMREAAENADAALARGKAYEAKYGPLLKQLEEVNASYKELTKQKEDMDKALAIGEISTEEYAKFEKKLQETGAELKELRAQKKAADQEFSGAKINQSQYDALQRELQETEQQFRDTETEAKSFGSTLGQLSQKTADFSSRAGNISDAFAPVSTAIAGLGAAAVATIPATEEFRADMSMLEQNAKNAGISMDATTEAFRTFNAVSGEVDSSVEAVSNLLQAGTTESNLQRAVENLAGAAEMFPDTLKIESLADSLQETVRTGEATGQFAELVERLGLNLDQVNNSLSATSDESQRLNNMLDMLSSQGLQANHQDWVQENQDLVDSRDAQIRLTEATADLAETLLPIMSDVVDAISGLLEGFNALPDGVQAGIGGLLLFIGAISPVAGAISNTSSLLGRLSTLLSGMGGSAGGAAQAISGVSGAASGLGGSLAGVLKSAGAVFLGPVGIAVGAGVAAVGIARLWDTNEGFRSSMMDFDRWITGVFTTDWSESFGAAGEVLNGFFANAQNTYEAGKQFLGGIIDFINGTFTGDWERAWTGITDIFGGAWGLLESIAKAPLNGVIGAVNSFLQFVTDGINSLSQLLNNFSVDVPSWVPGIGGKSLGFDLPTLTAPQIPYLADGALAKKNNPFLAVVGDNRREDEIISPISTIIDAVKTANAQSAGGRQQPLLVSLNISGELAPLFRYLKVGIDAETARQGVNLIAT